MCLFDQGLSMYESCPKMTLYLVLNHTPLKPETEEIAIFRTQKRRLFKSCAKMAQLLSVPYFFSGLVFKVYV